MKPEQTLVINVGEDVRMYVEIYPKDIDEDLLKLGDTHYDENGSVYVWHGKSTSNAIDDETGWIKMPQHVSFISAITDIAFETIEKTKDKIIRILNNDMSFNEAEYLSANKVVDGKYREV